MASALLEDRVWVQKSLYDDAERRYYENLAKNIGINKTMKPHNENIFSQNGETEHSDVSYSGSHVLSPTKEITKKTELIPKMRTCPLLTERVWTNKSRFVEAERMHHEMLTKQSPKGIVSLSNKLNEINSNGIKSTNQMKRNANKNPMTITIHMRNSADTFSDLLEDSSMESESNDLNARQSTTKGNKNNGKGLFNAREGNSKIHSSRTILQRSVEMNGDFEDVPNESKLQTQTAKNHKKKNWKPKSASTNRPNTPRVSETNAKLVDSKAQRHSKNKVVSSNECTLVSEIAKARQHIKNSLEKMDDIITLAAVPASTDILERLAAVEKQNTDLYDKLAKLTQNCLRLETQVNDLKQKLP